MGWTNQTEIGPLFPDITTRTSQRGTSSNQIAIGRLTIQLYVEEALISPCSCVSTLQQGLLLGIDEWGGTKVEVQEPQLYMEDMVSLGVVPHR